MARYCPIKNGPALYPECRECDERLCEREVFYCLVVGSRSYEKYPEFCHFMDVILSNKKDVVIVSGGARGADFMAKKYAREHEYFYHEFPADWDRYGKRAGYIRNREMHEYISHQKDRGVVAFWDGKSKGTKHSIELAKEFGNPIRKILI